MTHFYLWDRSEVTEEKRMECMIGEITHLEFESPAIHSIFFIFFQSIPQVKVHLEVSPKRPTYTNQMMASLNKEQQMFLSQRCIGTFKVVKSCLLQWAKYAKIA